MRFSERSPNHEFRAVTQTQAFSGTHARDASTDPASGDVRVALVAQEYHSTLTHGGIGTQTHVKARGLAALGHEVVILSHSPDVERHEEIQGNVRLIQVPGSHGTLPIHTESVRWLAYSGQVAAELAALHSMVPLDLVDFPEYGAEGYVHLLNRTLWNHVPTVVHLHGPLGMLAHTINWPELDSEFYRVGTAMEATCVRLADAVFSSSQCSADWCARLYGLDTETVPIIHTGVDTTHFVPGETEPPRPTIVFVGRIAESKGAEVLLDAAVQLAGEVEGLKLRMVGHGKPDLLEKLRARAREAGRQELLEFTGFASRDTLPPLLQDAHVFAGPSRYEGGPGFVYLEAMACGLPVIACSGSGATEVVTNEETGLLVPPDDTNALLDALRRVFRDDAWRRATGRRARAYAEREMSSDVCIRRIETFYAEVVGGTRTKKAAR